MTLPNKDELIREGEARIEKNPLTLEERDRRYKRIRSAMEKNELDCLIISGGGLAIGGPLGPSTRYITNRGACDLVIFPREGNPTAMTFVAHRKMMGYPPEFEPYYPHFLWVSDVQSFFPFSSWGGY